MSSKPSREFDFENFNISSGVKKTVTQKRTVVSKMTF
jgi:hypothetical protein